MGSYAKIGPFTNGAAPGISQTFLNGLETWIGQVDNTTGIVLSGATSGTATLYQPFVGFFKVVMCYCNNFRNGGGSNQNIVLPTAFTSSIFIINGGTPPVSLLKAGSAQTIQVTTSLATPNGSVSGATVLGNNEWSHMDAGFDTLQFNSGSGVANTGLVLFIGL